MTGRHEAPVRASDSWLVDQLQAWTRDLEAYFQACADATERASSLTTEQMWDQIMRQNAAKTVLLCTARQLIAEVLSRG